MISLVPEIVLNRLKIVPSQATTSALILVRPYPGWRLDEGTPADFVLNSLCSIFYSVEIGSGYGNSDNIDLVYAPSSFRFGLFVSLLSAFLCAQILVTNIAGTQKLQRVPHERTRQEKI